MLTKNDLIQRFADKMLISKTDAKTCINTLLDILAEALKKEGGVTLTGIGKISVQQKAARIGVDPRTKAPIVIPACRKLKITPSSGMLEILNHQD